MSILALGLALVATFPQFSKGMQPKQIPFNYLWMLLNLHPKMCLLVINLVPFNAGFSTAELFGSFQSFASSNDFSEPGMIGPQLNTTITLDHMPPAMSSLMTQFTNPNNGLLYAILVVHNISFLVVNIFHSSDWITYFIMSTLFSCVYALGQADGNEFLTKNLTVMFFAVVIFSANEKVRKESFIINLTNSKTKKQLMKLFNESLPRVIITKEGLIQICNEGFEHLIHKRLA